MPKTDHNEFNRLVLQIERDLAAQANLRALLTTAGKTVSGHREELRTVKARIQRAHRV